MGKKTDQKKVNFLFLVGRPAFKSLILLISLAGFIFLFCERFFSTPLNLPTVHFPKVKLPTLSFPQLQSSTKRFLIFFISSLLLATTIYFEIFFKLPNPKQLSEFPSKLTTQILDRNGILLYKIYKDENRTLVSIDNLPQHVIDAFLAAEDKDFYSHNGFSLPGMLRSIYRDIFDNRLEGGSTITQQLIKNTILSSEKTFSRKVKELILAIWAERIYSKDKILEMYLNQVGFGGPAYGIQEASHQYFDIDAADLNVAQAAFLASLTRAPSKYSPFGEHPELASERQKIVLGQMAGLGMITPEQYNQAISEKLDFRSSKIEILAPHFVMLVKNILVNQLGENVVTQGGLKVYTTLDSKLQDQAQRIVTSEIKTLERFHVSNGAALVTNPKTGEVLAMVGSKDYFNLKENGQVNLTTSVRQPGSSIKPLNYALYFEKGHSPASVIEDRPIAVRLASNEVWTPKNYDSRFHGSITLRQALGSSYNIPSVLILLKNGIGNFADFAKKLGITTWDDPTRYGPSLALGSLEVKMVDLATAYSTFANQGITTPLQTIMKIERGDSETLRLSSCPSQINVTPGSSAVNADETSCTPKRNISPTTAYIISDILGDNSARSSAFGLNSVLNIKKAKVAVKTGTSNDLRDNWTIGFSENFLVATWVGNNDNRPMANIASGITGASPIWAKIFNSILEEHQEPQSVSPPDNLIKVPICILTGTLTCSGCPTRIDYFIKGTEPKTACDPADIQKRLNPTPSSSYSSTPQIL